jgi:methyl-accepting chemotaxis protein
MLDFIIASGATVSIVVTPDQAMRDQMNRIEDLLQRLPPNLVERIDAMTAAAQNLQKELGENRTLIGQLVGKIQELGQKVGELSQTIKDNAGDSTELVDAAADLDSIQTDTNTFLAGLADPAATFADSAAFNTAVSAYTGAKGITLDATSVKPGTPVLDYFTHSADGHIDMTGPTD